jgi:perosamine synthetase
MILLNQPLIRDDEIANVNQALHEGCISGLVGSFIGRFEKEFSHYCGARYGVATSSGTTALHLALAVLGIGPGDEVIIPAFTHITSAFSVFYCGATPVLADCQAGSLGIDPSHIQQLITPRTKAVLVVHLYGHPADMYSLVQSIRPHGIAIIEDAAEAHGAAINGQKVGSFGDLACFSFLANKVITTGEGGMIVTNSYELTQRARLLRNLAFEPEHKFLHHVIGFNYRMSNILAALGVAQLKRIDQIIHRKRQIASYYSERFKDISGLTIPTEEPGCKHVYWVYLILVDSATFGCSRDEIISELKKRGIETRAAFVPMHLQPVVQAKGLFIGQKFPVAEDVAMRGLYLPVGAGMTDGEVEYVADCMIATRS